MASKKSKTKIKSKGDSRYPTKFPIKSQHKSLKIPFKRSVYSSKKSRVNSMIEANKKLKKYGENLEHHYQVIKNAGSEESDLEMYAISNKIIYILLLQVLIMGTTQSIQLAKTYSNKMGIDLCQIPGIKDAVSEKTLRKIKKCAPSIKNTVSKTRERYYKPMPGSIAPGWVWS